MWSTSLIETICPVWQIRVLEIQNKSTCLFGSKGNANKSEIKTEWKLEKSICSFCYFFSWDSERERELSMSVCVWVSEWICGSVCYAFVLSSFMKMFRVNVAHLRCSFAFLFLCIWVWNHKPTCSFDVICEHSFVFTFKEKDTVETNNQKRENLKTKYIKKQDFDKKKFLCK